MPRRSRIRLPGLPLHIVQRGVNRTACFLSDGDRMHYLDLLGRAAAGEGCSVHAYVLMSNHVHMLVSPSEPSSPSRMMKRLGEVYVAHFNKRHGRTGTLWEGRFKSSVVDSALYLLQCYRYIELNPVRAGMVTRPRDHPWSSYRANAEGAASILLTPHPEYIALAATVEERCATYRRLFGAAMSDDELELMRRSINSGSPLGSSEFVAQMELRTGRQLHRNKGGRPRRKPGSVPGIISGFPAP